MDRKKKAIEKTWEFFYVQGEIILVTFDKAELVAMYENGKQFLGEHNMDEPDEKLAKYKIVRLEVLPKAKANPRAINFLKKADLIVIGPGDLYTSILPNLLVEGIPEAVRKSKAKVCFVVNLMTRWGQTNNFTAKDFLFELEKYLGKGVVDVILINKGKIPVKALSWYREDFVSRKSYKKQ